MSRITGFERDISKLENSIEKQQETIKVLSDQLYHKKISEATCSGKNVKIFDRIRGMDSRMQLLRAVMIKEKQRFEEKMRKKEHT